MRRYHASNIHFQAGESHISKICETERNIYCKIRKKERSGTRRKKKRSKKETQREREGLYSRVSKEENNYFGMKEKQPQLYTVFN